MKTGTFGFGHPCMLLVVVCLLFCSCIDPLEPWMVLNARDVLPPTIIITSPSNGDVYQSSVTIVGTITDCAATDGDAGAVTCATVSLPATQYSADLAVDIQGDFLVSVPTRGLTGEIEIVFSATDWNSNITEAVLTLTDDETGPAITISAPSDQSYYAASVVVNGSVANSSTAIPGAVDEIQSLSWEVLSSTLAGSLDFGTGTYSFQFPTTALSGNVVVRLTAEDWNGNTTRQDLILLDGGSGIPSFAVVPGNGSAVFMWEPVALSAGYTLYDAGNDTTYAGATSPYTVSDLVNGNQYSFQLASLSSSGDNNVSEIESCIPLSPNTLVPTVSGQYNGIRLNWPSLPGTDRFQVLRGLDPDGPFAAVSGALSTTTFLDTLAARDILYWYRVKPYSDSAPECDAAPGLRSFFPASNQRVPRIVTTPGTLCSAASDVVVEGDYAYLVERYWNTGTYNRISVVDVSDPATPRWVNSVGLPYEPWCVTADDDYLYVGGYRYFRIYSLENPTLPELKYDYMPGDTRKRFGIALAGGYAYVATETNGCAVFDVSDIEAGASWVRNETVLGTVWDVVTDGSYLYLATTAEAGEFKVYDISDAAKKNDPVPVTGGNSGVLDLPAIALDLAISGGTIYAADQTGGIRVINVTSKSSPVESGHYNTAPVNNTWGVTVRGKFAYTGDSDNGIHVLDVSTPASISLLRSYPSYGGATRLTVSDQWLYVADAEKGMQIIDIAEPAEPALEATIAAGTVLGVDADAGICVAALSSAGGVKIYDVSTPASYSLLDSVPTTSAAYRPVLQGGYVYVAETNVNAGLDIIDIRDPENSLKVGVFRPSNNGIGQDVAVFGDRACLVSYSPASLVPFSVADATAPEAVGFLGLGGTPKGIKMTDTNVYVVDSEAGKEFKIVDISDPTLPYLVGSYDLPAGGYDVDLSGSRAYIADDTGGLVILDISDPTNPSLLGSFAFNWASAVEVVGDYAFVAGWNAGNIRIFDVSDPASIRQLAVFSVGGTAYDIVVDGEYCYVAVGAAGVKVLDLWPWND